RTGVPRALLVHLRRVRLPRPVPRLLLPVPDGTAHPAHRGPAQLRGRCELVGHPWRLRERLLHQAVYRTPALDRNGVPVYKGLLLQHRDPGRTRMRVQLEFETMTFKSRRSCAHVQASAVASINVTSHAGHPWMLPRSEEIPGKEAAGLLPVFCLACGLR